MKRSVIKKLILTVALCLALSLSFTYSFTAFAKNGGNFASAGQKPLAVTVTFYDDYNSRGWCWTTTSPVAAPVVQLLANASEEDADWSAAETIRATTTVTDSTYYTHKAYKTNMAEGKYIYRVGNGSLWSDVGSIDINDGKDGFTFLFMTDPQDYDKVGFTQWANLVAKAYEIVPSAAFMANGGDVVNNSHDAQDHDMDQWIYALELPKQQIMNSVFVPAAGNHDSWSTSFADRFCIDFQGSTQKGGKYTFTYGDMFFAVMNTNESGASLVEQTKWLAEQLKNTDKKWKIVMEHKGLISTGDHSNESDVNEWRKYLLPIMAEYKVDMMLQGHDHVYVRSKPYLYGSNGGENYNGRIPNMEETLVTEIVNGEEKTYSVEPGGTFYVTANYAGRKSYPPVDYDKTLIYPAVNPYNGKAMSIQIQQQMFTSISINGDTLEYNAYTYDGTDATLYDTYNIKKNTYSELENKLENAPEEGAITVFDANVMKDALDAYGKLVARAQQSLSDGAKAKIQAYSQLIIDDYLKAYEVACSINELGDAQITATFAKSLKQIKGQYADLTEAQQALVTNYAEVSEKENLMINMHAANALSQMIAAYRAGTDGITLREVSLAYNTLSEEQKALVIGAEGLDLSLTEESSSAQSGGCSADSKAPIIVMIVLCSLALVAGAFAWIRRRKDESVK